MTTYLKSMAALPQLATGEISEGVNDAILQVIRANVIGRCNAMAHRRALNEKACLIVDFDHFRRLCVGDLRDAFNDDRQPRSRMARNRRRTWLAMFRCYAKYAGIEQGIRIVALDRQGHYACELVDNIRKDEWSRFVRLAENFGIDEVSLERLCDSRKTQVAVMAIEQQQQIDAPGTVACRPLNLVPAGPHRRDRRAG